MDSEQILGSQEVFIWLRQILMLMSFMKGSDPYEEMIKRMVVLDALKF